MLPLELRFIKALFVVAVILAILAVLRLTAPAVGHVRRLLPWSSFGEVHEDQRVRLARADDAVRRAAEHAATVDSQVRIAVVRRQLVLRRAERARERVRIASAESLVVELTPGGPVQDIGVPPPVIERIVADSTAIVALGTEVAVKDSLLDARRVEIQSDSGARAAAGALIGDLERQRRPRCGWGCGMVLGTLAAIAVEVVIQQVGRAAGNLRM